MNGVALLLYPANPGFELALSDTHARSAPHTYNGLIGYSCRPTVIRYNKL